eukprot:COSAG03_NODE_5840_length_1164_cov_1.862911_2_plen_96_part_00
MWGIVWLTSLSSPLLVWAFLPYLRGDRGIALCKCSGQRLAGVCGGLGSGEEAAEVAARALITPHSTTGSSSAVAAEKAGSAARTDARPSENALAP